MTKIGWIVEKTDPTGKITYTIDERIPENKWIKKSNVVVNQYWDPAEPRPTNSLTEEIRSHREKKARQRARRAAESSQMGEETDDEMKTVIEHLHKLDTRTEALEKQQIETHKMICDMRQENTEFFRWMRENFGGFQKDYVELKGKLYSKFPPSMEGTSHDQGDESVMPTNDLEGDEYDESSAEGGGGDDMDVETAARTQDDFE